MIGFIQDANSVRALSFSDDAEVTAGVVFAGYGIVVPDSQNFGYDSYATLDVKDKIVVVLRYFPEDADKETKAILARYSDLRYKAMQARQHGAKAMLVVTGPRSPNAGELVPMTFDTAIAGSGIPAASIDGATRELDFPCQRQVAGRRAEGTRFRQPARGRLRDPEHHGDAEDRRAARHAHRPQRRRLPSRHELDGGRRASHGSSSARTTTTSDAARAATRCAAKKMPASRTSAPTTTRPERRRCWRWPRRCRSSRRAARNVVFALWSAEELGLVGSAEFVSTPPLPIEQIDAYINFDMVGRMQDNKLTAQATGTSPVVAVDPRARQRRAPDSTSTLQEDPYQPTDVASFNQAGVPSLSFTTGAHVDYHKPSDTADKIDYADLDRVADFATTIVRRLMDTEPPHVRQGRTVEPDREPHRRARLHRHRPGLHLERQGPAAGRRHRRRSRGSRPGCRRAT